MTLACEGKDISGDFTFFRASIKDTSQELQARIVATLLLGTSCDLESNADRNLSVVTSAFSWRESFNGDLFVSVLFDEKVSKRWQSGAVPLLSEMWWSCEKRIIDATKDFKDYELVGLPAMTAGLEKNNSSFSEEDVAALATGVRAVSADTLDRRNLQSLSGLRFDQGYLLAKCASGAYFLDSADSPDGRISEIGVTGFLQELALEKLDYAGAKRAIAISQSEDGYFGKRVFKDWVSVSGGVFFYAGTSTEATSSGSDAPCKHFGYDCDAITRSASVVEIFDDESSPYPVSIEIGGGGEIEVKISSMPDFGEVRYRKLRLDSDADFVELLKSANGEIVMTYSDGSEARLSSRGSKAAIDSAQSMCKSLIKKSRS